MTFLKDRPEVGGGGGGGRGGIRIPVPSIEIIQNPTPNMKKGKIPTIIAKLISWGLLQAPQWVQGKALVGV